MMNFYDLIVMLNQKHIKSLWFIPASGEGFTMKFKVLNQFLALYRGKIHHLKNLQEPISVYNCRLSATGRFVECQRGYRSAANYFRGFLGMGADANQNLPIFQAFIQELQSDEFQRCLLPKELKTLNKFLAAPISQWLHEDFYFFEGFKNLTIVEYLDRMQNRLAHQKAEQEKIADRNHKEAQEKLKLKAKREEMLEELTEKIISCLKMDGILGGCSSSLEVRLAAKNLANKIL